MKDPALIVTNESKSCFEINNSSSDIHMSEYCSNFTEYRHDMIDIQIHSYYFNCRF